MAGALMALVGLGGGSGSSGSPAAVAWGPMYGTDAASSNTQAFSGFTGALSISAALSGGGILSYTLNAVQFSYTGAFSVHAGDTLSWIIGVGIVSKAGNLTVTDATHSTTLATIAYSVATSWTGSRYQ